MKSSKYEYRIVTSHDGQYAVQFRPTAWTNSVDRLTLEEANESIERSIARDNFVPVPVDAPL